MSNATRTVKHNFKIYALYDPEKKTAFLGKSYAKNLAPMYSKHICGKNHYTSEYFGKAPPLDIPKLSILESINGTYRDAYRHLVAWTRIFLDAGYKMLMQNGTIAYATSLVPATKAIYDTICTEPLDIVLQHGHRTVAKTIISNTQNTTNEDNERMCMSVQFNMRVFQEDMLQFIKFCEDQGLSRKEGFALLLRSCPYVKEDCESYADEEIKHLKNRLAEQSVALKIAQDKLEQLSATIRNDIRYQSLLNTVQSLLRDYCQIVCVDAQPFMKLNICKYHNFPNVSQFTYPHEEQGIHVITLHGLVYGRGRTPAIFVLARGEDNQLYKFRTYPKKGYVGIHLPGSAWTYLGAKWLVIWNRANDGAIELTGSLPISLSLDTLTPDDYPSFKTYSEKPNSLDEIIRCADARKGQK